MECSVCQQKQRQFYCHDCLKQHVLSFRLQSTHLAHDRDASVASAQNSLSSVVQPARLRRADVRECEDRVREVWDGLEGVRKHNDSLISRIRDLRDTLSTRRRTLAIASTTLIPSASSSSSASSHSRSHSSSASPPLLSTSPSTPSRPSALSIRRMSGTTARIPGTTLPIPIVKSLDPTPSIPASTSTPPSVLTSASTSPRTRPLSVLARPNSQPLVSQVHSSPQPPSTIAGDPYLAHQIAEAESNLAHLSDTIARARSGLVQELVEVFSVVEVGGRPPVGGKAGSKGEWTIGGLVLPVPGDIRRYPPDHINAVLTHTIHFLSLLAFYLGIKLPFEVVWSRSGVSPGSHSSNSSSSGDSNARGGVYGLLGVGTPWIGAIRGGEGGGWARWSTKHPLHVSASSRPASTTPATSPTSPTSPSQAHSSTSKPTPPTSLTSSPIDLSDSTYLASAMSTPSSTSASGTSFTTALSMLLYDVCYLAFCEGVDIPLAQAGEVLGNLWGVCCSPELGRKSHATHPHIPYPTPPSFPLDFAQLLQATTSNPSRANARVRGFSSSHSKDAGGSGKRGGTSIVGTSGGRRMRGNGRREDVIEEEDGWDLV
ncbi:unnamed protein product [Somion occarium]|uniref:Autophagy-related protein 14 n=1 Tax=Somion occarium TaxID=3059160 RepID=A0ABP1DKT4_9APHY